MFVSSLVVPPVDLRRELIARFEKRIQATLARVWGEGENDGNDHRCDLLKKAWQ
jgi:hypothetical protein